jgi:uncharacterized protein
MYRLIVGSLIGLFGGVIGSIFGMSGAFVIIPLLLLFGICSNQLTAQGTTLCMLLPPISLFAVYGYYKKKHVDFEIALLMVIFYIFGTLIGSKVSLNMNEKKLRYYFGILLLSLTIYIFYSAYEIKEIDSS